MATVDNKPENQDVNPGCGSAFNWIQGCMTFFPLEAENILSVFSEICVSGLQVFAGKSGALLSFQRQSGLMKEFRINVAFLDHFTIIIVVVRCFFSQLF